MKYAIATCQSDIDFEGYGGKAYWLSWLYQKGYKIPYSVFLPVIKTSGVDEILSDKYFLSSLRTAIAPLLANGIYDIFLRSSAIGEDSTFESYAGHFKTVNGLMNFETVLQGIKKVIGSLEIVGADETLGMGVIIQEAIYPCFSGVLFSSNPVNGAKSESILSIIEGFGCSLVSGAEAGEDIIVMYNGYSFELPNYKSAIEKNLLHSLFLKSKTIEASLGHPVDIEWCIKKNTNEIYFLQCRPITGILSKESIVVPIKLKNENLIPNLVKDNDKVSLRLVGERTNVIVSPASIISVNCNESPPRLPELRQIKPSQFCKSYSLVLLHPSKISGKVKRSFIGIKGSEEDFLNICCRYSIRSFPEYESVEKAVSAIVNSVFPEYWQAIMIVQEIFDPEFTGVIRRIDDGYLIELAKGHFVPKGVVPTSQYVIDFNGYISFAKEVKQVNQYKIINGLVINEEVKSEFSLVSVSQELLNKVVSQFNSFLTSSLTAVEFGILKHDFSFVPYLIDFVEDTSKIPMNIKSISEGVLSRGIVTGKLAIVENHKNEDALNVHFHDNLTRNNCPLEPTIIFSDKPDISLLRIIQNCDETKLGFIFKSGSVLCHLAIVLRERGIPAIIVSELQDIIPGTVVTLDATSSGLNGKERVIINV